MPSFKSCRKLAINIRHTCTRASRTHYYRPLSRIAIKSFIDKLMPDDLYCTTRSATSPSVCVWFDSPIRTRHQNQLNSNCPAGKQSADTPTMLQRFSHAVVEIKNCPLAIVHSFIFVLGRNNRDGKRETLQFRQLMAIKWHQNPSPALWPLAPLRTLLPDSPAFGWLDAHKQDIRRRICGAIFETLKSCPLKRHPRISSPKRSVRAFCAPAHFESIESGAKFIPASSF